MSLALKKRYFMNITKSNKIIVPTIETLGATLSSGLSYMGSARVGNYIYVFGGSGASMSNKIFKFDITTETITQIATTIPTTLSLMGCGVYGQYIYLIGGFNGSARVKTIYKFDTTNETISLISAELPSIRSNFGYAQVGKKVYVIAGYSTSSQKDIMVFDMETETASTLATQLPSIRHNLLAVAKGTDIYIFGGQDSSVYRDAYILDTTTNTLTALTTLMPDCQSYFGGLFGNDIYIFGGSKGSTLYKTIYKFDTSDNSLTLLNIQCPESVYSATMSVVDDQAYYFGFYFGGNTAQYVYTNKIVKFSLIERKPLPSAYQEVEYIESSGTQYINTLVNAGTNITAQIKFTSVIDGLFFLYRGDRNYTASSNQWRLFVANVGAQGDFVIWDLNTANMSGTGRCSAKTSNLGTPFEIEIGNMYIKDLKTNQYHNNEWNNNYNPTTQNSFTSNVPIYLFCGTPLGFNGSYGKCYYLKMYENGTLIRHFIPCYRKADGEIGLYDLVNDVFYTNQGSGSFTKGNDV